MAKIVVSGPFNGPNFVDGLSKQSNSYQVVNSTTAVLAPFEGGKDSNITYTMTVHGKGFGVDSNGRLTGVVESFVTVDNSQPDTSWTVTGYNSPLDVLNTNATANGFVGLLISPVQWKYIGDKHDDNFIGGPFDDTLKGNGGDDTFQGLGGDDMLKGGSGKDTLNGDEGNDTIVSAARATTS